MSKIALKIKRKIGSAIAKYSMIEANDKILIALSGGKDSWVLAHFLYELQKKAPIKFDLKVATFDPKFPDFGVEKIANFAKSQNWDFHSTSLDIQKIIEEKNFVDSPCVLCSRLRRGHLYKIASSLGCNKLALGHHADDACISFLMSFFRGQGITTMAPNVLNKSGNIRVIRPLILTEENDIQTFFNEQNFPLGKKCIYNDMLDASGDRQYFKNLLATLEKRIPYYRTQCLKSMSNIEYDYLLKDHT